MTRNELVTLIAARFNYRSDLESKIIAELKNAQLELEEELISDPPWFLLSEVAETTGQVGKERLPLPDDFLLEYDEGTLWVYDITETDDPWIELKKGRHDKLKEEYVGTGRPIRYAIVGEYFRVFPTPDKAYVYRMLYYKRQEVLDTNIENNWLKYSPWLIGGKAGFNLAHNLEHERNQAFFEGKYTESYLSLEKKARAREEANMEESMDDMEP